MENENQTEGENTQLDSAQEHRANDTILNETRKKKITLKKILKLVILFIMLVFVWVGIVQYMAADKYDAVVKVVEEGGKIGVNPTAERLDYGDIPKGNALTRFITIENNGNMDIYVAVVKFGSVAELIKISKNNFTLYAGDDEKIELTLAMPISANKEEYKGKVIVFKLPKLF